MSRFENRWRRWDDAIREGKQPTEFLPQISDDSLVELLAGGDIRARRYEMDIVATEILNRLRRTREGLHQAAIAATVGIDNVDRAAHRALNAVKRSESAILDHLAERNDVVANEPEAAGAAVSAAQETAEKVTHAVEAKEKIVALHETVKRNARHHEP